MVRRSLLIVIAFAVTVLSTPDVARGAPSRRPAPPDRYIVVLNEGVDATAVANEHARKVGGEIRHVYGRALKGYAARIPSARLDELKSDPRISYIEPDAEVTADAQTVPWGISRISANLSSTAAGNGAGAVGAVSAYIVDSGVSPHADLNLVSQANWTGDGKNYDCNGHGTHVAGTVGAKDDANHVVGAAPGVAVTALKVLTCDGSGLMSNVIAAIDWLTTYGKKPAVANLSLSGPPLQSVDDAMRRSASSGVLYVLAAGNSGANACNYSPARAGAGTNNGIVTVAATDSSNRETSWSNYGSCVDIWAPGASILSTYNNGGTAYMSGTSMASPHVAGAAALYLSRNTTVAPATAEGVLKTNVVAPGTASKDGRSIRLVSARKY